MPKEFPIYLVRTESTDGGNSAQEVLALEQQSEQMGSKQKFWLKDALSQRTYLFKYSRNNTGEHWSEKVAAEIAELLGLPHARVELAVHHGAPGVIVEDVRADQESVSLLHGNELLLELDSSYPHSGDYRVSEHTIERVKRAFDDHDVQLPDTASFPRALPELVADAWGLFVGYLLLDTLIGNTDRHHENWAVTVERDSSRDRLLRLAPTYDHASSLGRELTDDKRTARLKGTGDRGIDAYARRARSAFYANASDKRPLSPQGALTLAGRLNPDALTAWLSRCEEVGLNSLIEPMSKLPLAVASATAVSFAIEQMRCNYREVTSLRAEAGLS